MKTTFKLACNFIVTIIFVILMIYVSFFTDIPRKTGNIIRQKLEEREYKFEQYSSNFNINKLTTNTCTYYYSKLTDDQKKIYESIANGVKNFQSEFVIRDYNAGYKEEFASEVNIAIESFINDHPEVFYLKSQYSSYIVESFNGNIGYVKINYTDDVDVINEKIDAMDKKITEYTDGLENKTEFEKELLIHDKLANNVKYSKDEELPRQYHTAEGALLDGIGVCDSFSKALQLLYDRIGIDSIIVLGTLDGSPHAWNLVKIDNGWYHVDLTSSHSIYDETGIINHAYFNLTTQNMKKIATLDDEEIIPTTDSDKYNFYVYNELVIKENDNLDERLSDITDRNKDVNYIEFYLEGVVGNKISDILVSLKGIDKSFVNGSKMYYYNIQNAIIIPKN